MEEAVVSSSHWIVVCVSPPQAELESPLQLRSRCGLQVIVCTLLNAASPGPSLIPGAPPPSPLPTLRLTPTPPPHPTPLFHPNATAAREWDQWPERLPPPTHRWMNEDPIQDLSGPTASSGRG